MPDWDELSKNDVDVADLKRRVPLEFVVAMGGVHLEDHDGKLVGLCPFHPDTDPSFDIFVNDSGEEKCGCWSCDFGRVNDHLDFIARWKGIDKFSDQVAELVRLGKQLEDSGFQRTVVQSAQDALDFDILYHEIQDAQWATTKDFRALETFLDNKKLRPTPEWVIQHFRVGVQGDNTIIVPHFDKDGRPTGYKRRTYMLGEGWTKTSRKGSKYVNLYGCWLDRGKPEVIMTEGETDTWTMRYLHGETHDVLGLPSGANMKPRPEHLEMFKDRIVTIVFDADAAGRGAAREWAAVLHGIAAMVRVAQVEDGQDASGCSHPERVLDDAMTVVNQDGNCIIDHGHFAAAGGDDSRMLCNWYFEPERYLRSIDPPDQETVSAAWEGLVMPLGERAEITSSDVKTKSSITNWSTRNKRSWFGSDRDAQLVSDWLHAQSPFLARGGMTSIAGFHDGYFVIPGGPPIGHKPLHVRYVPPRSDISLSAKVDIRPGVYIDRAGFLALFALHRHAITTPILAWLAAAPLRSTLKQFPTLFVQGSSGTGKTTLLTAMLEAFGWKTLHTLTSTTPYALESAASATNGIPIWVDEYRTGARTETKGRLEQIVRDAWDGSSSMRGGVKDNLSAVASKPALAPLVVSGEDAFAEVSLMERSATVSISKEGRSPDALMVVRRSNLESLGYRYLSWLSDMYRGLHPEKEMLPKPDMAQVIDRPSWAREMLRWGYELLRFFATDVLDVVIPDPDFSSIEHAIAEAQATSPYLEALQFGLEQFDRDNRNIVWYDGDDMLVRVRALVSEVVRDGTIPLPGNTKAVKKWLHENFDARDTKAPGTNLSVMRCFNARQKMEAGEVR